MIHAVMNPKHPILLIDDETAWLRSLSVLLERSCGLTKVLTCQDPRQALDVLHHQAVSLVIVDMVMPHITGEELLEQISLEHPEIPVIILTGMDKVEAAVSCIRKGAFDYFVKTMEEERLLAGIRRALHMSEISGENRQLREKMLRERLDHPEVFDPIITRDSHMYQVFQYLEAVSPGLEPILITGESGTGKELVARAVYQLGRPHGPWVPINVAGLDEQQFSDTLFGHVRGAFTGADRARPGLVEQATGGTLFLDEIGDLSPGCQVKLLRLLQEGEYLPLGSDRPRKADIRVVAATNQNLHLAQMEGRFRRDLYYRLSAHQVCLPPLRERTSDLPLLLQHFLREAAQAQQKPAPSYPPQLLTLLRSYSFPGNLRELRGMVYEAVSLHRSGILSMAAFEKAIQLDRGKISTLPRPEEEIHFPPELPTIEQTIEILIAEAMRRTEGNQTQAARLLGISRPALYKRLRKTG